MANIIKAMKLDFDLVKVYVKAICFTLLIPVVFAIINRSLMTSVSFATCLLLWHLDTHFQFLKKMEWSAYMGYCLLQKKNLF